MTTALYVHGLEAGPRGRKSVELERAGFRVVSEQMPCGRKQIAADPAVIAAGAATVGAVLASGLAKGAKALALATGAAAVARPFAMSRLMRRVFERSVAVQIEALRTNAIDVVVGSSFGGAVALELLLRGAWKGPTLLLCPAHELVSERSWKRKSASLTALPEAVAARVLVVHGLRDETVEVSHSQRLTERSAARLVLVDDDHRLSASSNAERLSEWLAAIGVSASAGQKTA